MKDGVYITYAIPLQVTAKPGKIKEKKNCKLSCQTFTFHFSKKGRNIAVARDHTQEPVVVLVTITCSVHASPYHNG
jgi:hypothetical protein